MSSGRFVTIPAPVTLQHLALEVPLTDDSGHEHGAWSVYRFFVIFVATDPTLPPGRKSMRTVARVRRALRPAQAGEVVELVAEDWESIKAVLDKPTGPAWKDNSVVAQFDEFVDALYNAAAEAPALRSLPPAPGALDVAAREAAK